MNTLEIDSILKSYGNSQILTDIYLKCKTGETIGLLGRNGAGKSTLIQVIYGTITAQNRHIRVNNQHYEKVFKHPYLLNCLPSFRFLPRSMKVKNVVKYFFKSESCFLEDEVIQKIMNERINNLSSGEQRYLEIFLIIHADSMFSLLDEPFNGLSPVYREDVVEQIKDMTHSKGFIITDHDYKNVMAVSNRIYLLKEGAIREIEDLKDLEYYGYL